ncbi:unnamed protein product [Rotaria sordida]|uniref:Tetratricopeptide repeat protein n=1 Tax=Rotaria sordida TaxID=392033 RepID=A0A819IVL7_9BILA|nr:unnamed protein product [Rotaria sordida]
MASATTTSDCNAMPPNIVYAVPPTSLFHEKLRNSLIKDLNEDSAWFIQFQLLVEILLRLEKSARAKTDLISICREYYKDNKVEQHKITQFEEEAENISKVIYWYTAESFIIHLLNRRDVAEMFAGAGVSSEGEVCVLFELNIESWDKCKPSAVIKPEDSAMKDEDEVLFSIGSIWKIVSVGELKERDLNLPETHVDRAGIYNRLGLIRWEQQQLPLAIEYFEKAVKAAPINDSIKKLAKDNLQLAQDEHREAPVVFLRRRLVLGDVTIKRLPSNTISTPIAENNLGYIAHRERNYDLAIAHYKKAISIIMESELAHLLELSCVYNNLGAVEYHTHNYSQAKEYFEKAIFTIQQLNSNHPWIDGYKENLSCAQKQIFKRSRSN